MTEFHVVLAATAGSWVTGIIFCVGIIVIIHLLRRLLITTSRPQLTIEYYADSYSDNRFLPPSRGDNLDDRDRQELWIRIRIKNESGFTAQNVQARFTSSEIEGGQHRENRPSWWFKVSNLNAVSTEIPPYFTQYFDIAYLVHDIWSGQLDGFIAITQPEMGPWRETKSKIENTAYTRLSLETNYYIYFAIVGNDIPAAYYRMRIELNAPTLGRSGEITELELRRCMRVEKPVSISAAQAFAETRMGVQQ